MDAPPLKTCAGRRTDRAGTHDRCGGRRTGPGGFHRYLRAHGHPRHLPGCGGRRSILQGGQFEYQLYSHRLRAGRIRQSRLLQPHPGGSRFHGRIQPHADRPQTVHRSRLDDYTEDVYINGTYNGVKGCWVWSDWAQPPRMSRSTAQFRSAICRQGLVSATCP